MNRLFIFNKLTPKQNDQHLAWDIFKCILQNENSDILFPISPKIVPKGLTESALVQVMAWRRIGTMPLPEPMMTKVHDVL